MNGQSAQLAGGPFETQTNLTSLAQGVFVEGLIADDVCPRVRTAYKFTYTTFSEQDLLTIPNVRVSRTGQMPQVEFGSTDTTDSVVDYGLEDPVPQRDIDEAAAQMVPFDPLAVAAENTGALVKLAREKRVAELLFNTTSYAAGQSETPTGNAKWSNANANPLKQISEALDAPLVRPNTLVLGQAVWTQLRQHPRIVEAIVASGAGNQASGLVMKEAVANLLEIDRVIVGRAWYQSAVRGQADVFARLWGNGAALIHIKPGMSMRERMPTFCWTADAGGGMTAGTYQEPSRGIRQGSTVVKVSESVKELVAYDRAGYYWHEPVA